MNTVLLSEVAEYVNDRVSSSDVGLEHYVTTDCLLQNKKGRTIATNLPPQPCGLTRYRKDDILIGNIRPYLKKIWKADVDGGASNDVLVFRAINGHSPNFLLALLMQDHFYDYVMKGSKGSKMPRGDKEQIMRYPIPVFTQQEEMLIGQLILSIEQKIAVNLAINDNLSPQIVA